MSFSQDPNSNSEEKPEEKSTQVKVVVLGKSLVGKSALTYRFISDKFTEEHDTTVEDQYKTFANIDGEQFELEILDTAGQDDYQTMLDTWIEFGNCFILVYSIDEMDSFKQIKTKYDRICKLKVNEPFSVIIAGNKCDLPDSSRKVSKVEAESYAKNIDVPFLEVSALNRINVKEAFMQVVRNYTTKKQKTSDKKAMGCPCF